MFLLKTPFRVTCRYGKRSSFYLFVISLTLLSLYLVHLCYYWFNNYLYPLSLIVYSDQPYIQLSTNHVILIWTSLVTIDPTWHGVIEKKLSCGCFVTRDRSLLKYSKIIIFDWRSLELSDLPIKYSGQIWIWHNNEPPQYTYRPHILRSLQVHFDCWASYRQDSDFVVDYGRVYKLSEPKDIAHVNLSSKTDYIAWMVSNCGANSGRIDYVNELSKYIPVDIYGKCGSFRCSAYSDHDATYCWKKLADNYKFYLSFENSICTDYFTEKAFRSLDFDIIPIVFGGADYEKVMPENSFIDALKFGSPRYLAMFLRQLAQDEARYNNYFKWKSHFKAVARVPYRYDDILCDICFYFKNNIDISCRGQREDLHDWWYDGAQCKSWNPNDGLIPVNRLTN